MAAGEECDRPVAVQQQGVVIAKRRRFGSQNGEWDGPKRPVGNDEQAFAVFPDITKGPKCGFVESMRGSARMKRCW